MAEGYGNKITVEFENGNKKEYIVGSFLFAGETEEVNEAEVCIYGRKATILGMLELAKESLLKEL